MVLLPRPLAPVRSVYDTDFLLGYGQYFHIYGSAILSARCLPQAFIGGTIGALPVIFPRVFQTAILNPSAYFSGITLVLGFLLVFRTQLAYDRYWEGRTTIQVLMSKLEDVAVHGKTFVRGQSPEIKKWRQQLGHLLNNYLTFVMADLRGMTDIDEVIETYQLVIDKSQYDALAPHHYRPYICMGWIVEHWISYSVRTDSKGDPGSAERPIASEPIQSRTYQILSEAQLAYNGAQKIQTTPFPFPLMQVCGMLLHVYMFSAPMVIGTFLNNFYLSPVLSFFSVLGFFALNKTSEELEDPFGVDPNDLPLEHFIKAFNFHLHAIGLLDKADAEKYLKQINEVMESAEGRKPLLSAIPSRIRRSSAVIRHFTLAPAAWAKNEALASHQAEVSKQVSALAVAPARPTITAESMGAVKEEDEGAEGVNGGKDAAPDIEAPGAPGAGGGEAAGPAVRTYTAAPPRAPRASVKYREFTQAGRRNSIRNSVFKTMAVGAKSFKQKRPTNFMIMD